MTPRDPHTKPIALPVQPDCIPPALKKRKQWVVWRFVRRGEKWTKPLFNARTGKYADVTDPSTWTSFEEAQLAYERGDYDGVGYVLVPNGGGVAFDLDHCRDRETGFIDGWAMDIVRRIDSYTEVSPTGTGLRIIAYGTLPPGGRKRDGIELYDSARYVTFTGNHLDGTRTSIEGRGKAIERFHREVFSRSSNARESSSSPVVNDAPFDESPVRLNSDGLAVWRGEAAIRGGQGPDGVDRSRSLMRLARVLFDANASRSTIVARLAERDHTFGWHKYCCRADRETRYHSLVDKLEQSGPTTQLAPACRAVEGPDLARENDRLNRENADLREQQRLMYAVLQNPALGNARDVALVLATDLFGPLWSEEPPEGFRAISMARLCGRTCLGDNAVRARLESLAELKVIEKRTVLTNRMLSSSAGGKGLRAPEVQVKPIIGDGTSIGFLRALASLPATGATKSHGGKRVKQLQCGDCPGAKVKVEHNDRVVCTHCGQTVDVANANSQSGEPVLSHLQLEGASSTG